jgi:hypothetical protein
MIPRFRLGTFIFLFFFCRIHLIFSNITVCKNGQLLIQDEIQQPLARGMLSLSFDQLISPNQCTGCDARLAATFADSLAALAASFVARTFLRSARMKMVFD